MQVTDGLDTEDRGPRRFEPWVRHLVAIAAAVSLGIFIASQRMSVSQEVRVVVPDRVSPGARFPVRVLVYRDLKAVAGPRLAAVTAQVRLHPAAKSAVPVPLSPGFGDTLEAELQAPAGLRGPLTLLIEFPDDPDAPAAEVVIAVGGAADDSAGAAPAPEVRQVRPLQRLSLGPVRRSGDARVLLPAPLTLAVASGGCVPERICDVFVHVADDVADVRLLRTPSVTPRPPPRPVSAPFPPSTPLPPPPTSGRSSALAVPSQVLLPGDGNDGGATPPAVTHLQVVVHGPEAVTELVASRAGAVVARRTVRLPVLLGVPALALQDAEGEPRLHLVGESGPCIVDRYVDGRFAASRTHPDCERAVPRPSPSARAVERVQVRRDPFAASSAAVYVPPANEPEALQRLAAEVLQRDPRDRLAKACARSVADCPADAGRYLAARASEGLWPVPRPVSGMTRAVQAVAAQRTRLRWATLLSLCLCGLSLAALVTRRGLSGGEQARAWMEAAEETRALERRARLRGLLVIAACVLALLLSFLAVALYVLARGGT